MIARARNAQSETHNRQIGSKLTTNKSVQLYQEFLLEPLGLRPIKMQSVLVIEGCGNLIWSC